MLNADNVVDDMAGVCPCREPRNHVRGCGATPTHRVTRPQQQTCKQCWQPDKFDFHVPDEIWEAVVPAHLQNRVLCLYCFDEFAAERKVAYAASLTTLYFAGRQATFEFWSV